MAPKTGIAIADDEAVERCRDRRRRAVVDGGVGGGIYANTTLTMTNATISGNYSTNTGGGIGLGYAALGTFTDSTGWRRHPRRTRAKRCSR
jgi:hypothetical protein